LTLRLGLTGSIATGKSTVLEVFARRGVPVFSADAAVHALYDGGEAVAPLGELFPEVVHSGKVDRAALSARLPADPKNLGRIEAIVHPLVRRRMRQFFADAAAKNLPLAVADVPLLFETGYDGDIDAVLVTAVDENTMRQRALARPGMTVEKLDAILARQMPQAEKKRRAGYVVDTGRPIRDTAAEVEALIDKLSAGR